MLSKLSSNIQSHPGDEQIIVSIAHSCCNKERVVRDGEYRASIAKP